MRFHVLQPDVLNRCDPCQGADLVEDEVLHLLRRGRHVAASEAHQIGESRMRPDRDAGSFRPPHGFAHHARVAGVKAARDIGGRDAAHHLGVVSERPPPERLADVRVEVD